MEFRRAKCLSLGCPAMGCPSCTGYCSHHDLERTPFGQRPGQLSPRPDPEPWLLDAKPITQMVQ